MFPTLFDRPSQCIAACTTVVLAHGAGAPMDSPFMTGLVRALVHEGLEVIRFEFAYMAKRRNGGAKRPPPKIEALIAEYRALIDGLANSGPLIIGGKSLGGRVATHVATDPPPHVRGVVAFGYPFHPPKKPEALRTAHLNALKIPLLIVQGARDPFGAKHEVEQMTLPQRVRCAWVSGDHDFGLRSGRDATTHEAFAMAATATAEFVKTCLAAQAPSA